MADKWYDPGNWVAVSDTIVRYYNLKSAGPYQILTVDRNHDELEIIIPGANGNITLWAKMDQLLPVKAPQPTLAEKERMAMEREPWRRRRDENLGHVFKPTPRERPVSKPVPMEALSPPRDEDGNPIGAHYKYDYDYDYGSGE